MIIPLHFIIRLISRELILFIEELNRNIPRLISIDYRRCEIVYLN